MRVGVRVSVRMRVSVRVRVSVSVSVRVSVRVRTVSASILQQRRMVNECPVTVSE